MTRIAVLISDNPGGGLDARARALFDRLPDRFESTLIPHRGGAVSRIQNFLRGLNAVRPALIYVIDPIYAAVIAAQLYRLTHKVPMILDTGDLVYDLAKELGKVGPIGLQIVKRAEQTALRTANSIVVRSTFHRSLLIERGYSKIDVIPDGVDLDQFYPTYDRSWREQFGLKPEEIVVGGVGSMHWNARRATCFGWDLIEALALLSDLPIKGLLIGDGDGRSKLEARAQELGLAEKIIFAGRVPYADLRNAINSLDICLLTQTNDQIAWVRTTGKLPLYLACDRYIIASEVGEAAQLLKPFDMLLPYAGTGRDADYPIRLANKIRQLAAQPDRLRLNNWGVELARQHFDYNRLAQSLAQVIDRTLA